MNDDIVARLRLNGGLDARLLCAAADEIERLRDQLRLANIDNFETTAEIERLRNELAACCRTPSAATTRTEGDPNSQLEELRSEVAAWRSAFRGEDEFDGRVE